MNRINQKTRDAMIQYAQTLDASHERAQCYTIANYELETNETIAQRLERDHRSIHSALRAADLMRRAGCASEVLSQHEKMTRAIYKFEDNSLL